MPDLLNMDPVLTGQRYESSVRQLLPQLDQAEAMSAHAQ